MANSPAPQPVLHVITASQRRGAEVFAVGLAEALAARGVPGRVVALTEGPHGNSLDVEILGRQPFGLATLRALRRAAEDAAVVVAYGSKTLPASVAALAATRKPLVYRNIGDPRVWSGHGLRRWRVAALLRRASRIVAVWPGAAEALTTVHGIPPERIVVIPRGVAADACPVPDRDARARARRGFGLPDDDHVVVCLGALSPEKDVATAIRATAELPDVHLLVAGDGPDRPSLEALAAGLAPRRIHFAGVVAGPQEALAAADAVLLTSQTEGMPGVLIEAGLSGLPAVASDVGGVGEIVRPGETGMLAQPGDVDGFADSLRRVLDDPAPLGRAARRWCLEHFELGVVAARWMELLRDVSA